jgi:hypothetical protein
MGLAPDANEWNVISPFAGCSRHSPGNPANATASSSVISSGGHFVGSTVRPRSARRPDNFVKSKVTRSSSLLSSSTRLSASTSSRPKAKIVRGFASRFFRKDAKTCWQVTPTSFPSNRINTPVPLARAAVSESCGDSPRYTGWANVVGYSDNASNNGSENCFPS